MSPPAFGRDKPDRHRPDRQTVRPSDIWGQTARRSVSLHGFNFSPDKIGHAERKNPPDLLGYAYSVYSASNSHQQETCGSLAVSDGVIGGLNPVHPNCIETNPPDLSPWYPGHPGAVPNMVDLSRPVKYVRRRLDSSRTCKIRQAASATFNEFIDQQDRHAYLNNSHLEPLIVPHITFLYYVPPMVRASRSEHGED